MSKRIAMVNAKGGVGKTTCSLLIAAALQDNGFDVVIDDRDWKQQNSVKFAPLMGLRVGTEAPFVIIDTSPDNAEPTLHDALRTADLVVLITSPSPSEMVTTAATAELIKQHRQGRTVLLINKLKLGTVLSRDVDELAKSIPFERLKNGLVDRQNYQKAQVQGWKALTKFEQNEVLKVALEIMA